MGGSRRKKSGLYALNVRLDPDSPLALYLAKLKDGARSRTIRAWLEEGYLRLPDALHAKANALREDARRLEAEADALNLMAIEARKGELAAKADLEDRRKKAWNELVSKGVAGQRFQGWITGPAGTEFLNRHDLELEEAVELHRKGGE